jgi:hypothetical protein
VRTEHPPSSHSHLQSRHSKLLRQDRLLLSRQDIGCPQRRSGSLALPAKFTRGSTFCKQKLPINVIQRAAPKLKTKPHHRRTRDKCCSGASAAQLSDICMYKAPLLGIPGSLRVHKSFFHLLWPPPHAQSSPSGQTLRTNNSSNKAVTVLPSPQAIE